MKIGTMFGRTRLVLNPAGVYSLSCSRMPMKYWTYLPKAKFDPNEQDATPNVKTRVAFAPRLHAIKCMFVRAVRGCTRKGQRPPVPRTHANALPSAQLPSAPRTSLQ